MKTHSGPVAAAIALALVASSASAVEDFYLAAKQYNKFLPDGTQNGFPVTMWGYVEDVGGGCYGTTPTSARLDCVAALPDPTVPGPRLVVPVGESNVRIWLTNALPEPSSIVIPGQELPWSSAAGPVWNGDRVRSFVGEANQNGGRRAYVWNNFRGTPFDGPGTFLYHSGTHPQKQVYMGLAGLVNQDFAAGQAYEGVPYDSEVTLFYSDIDPAFNEAVAAGTLQTAIDRHPTWFLVNGEPYETNVTAGINAGAAGGDALVRMASTTTDTHVVVMQGLNMTIHAEDGQQYNFQEGDTITPAPRVQYSAMLPPTKTKDAIVVAPLEGDYAVYDGNGYMTNPSEPANEMIGDEVGGMLRFLAFTGGGANQAPTANNDAASVVEGFSVNINVLGNDTDPEGDPLSIDSFDAMAGLSCGNGVAGACTYDAIGVVAGTPVSFTYIATDGPNLSNPATVSVTVTANQVPTANDDAANTDQDVAVVIDVAGNDTDPEGQTLNVADFDVASTGGQTVSCAGTDCTYTPSGGYAGADTFTYTVSDGVSDSPAATVTVTVVAPNLTPTAVDDPDETTSINTQLTGIDVLGNDTDPENDGLSIASYDAGSTVDGRTVACNTGVVGGTCTYTPATDFTGIDSFTYFATDGVNTSAIAATVTITVNPADAPALYFSTAGAGSVPGTAGPYDDADLYTVDAGGVFGRLYDAVTDLGLPNNANIDGISIDGTTIYVSFAAASTTVNGAGAVQDEDVVMTTDNGVIWSVFFDGSACGLDAGNGGDLDAISVDGSTLYFSTVGNVAVSGVASTQFDDADVYTWSSGDTSCGRALDVRGAGVPNILPGNADVDGLTVRGGDYYLSFNRNGGINVSGLGTVRDESVVLRQGGSWSLFFDGSGQLDGTNSQDVDAIHVP